MSRLPDFEGLAMFAKVTEEGSFAAAASAMSVSVATVSRAVTRLDGAQDVERGAEPGARGQWSCG